MGQHGQHRALVGLLLAGLSAAGAKAAPCWMALAVGLDVSGSVDRHEYGLQTGGLAAALMDRDVQAAIFAVPGAHVALTVYEWSGPSSQRMILPWVAITDPAALAGAAGVIGAHPRYPDGRMTAVGAAMVYGDALLAGQPGCARRTLDLASDGINNIGPLPGSIALAGGATETVNALVIAEPGEGRFPGLDPPLEDLADWYRAAVIRGPGAFVERAEGFPDFARAMRRKLLRELARPLAKAPGAPAAAEIAVAGE